MAQINEKTLIIKLSKLVKDNNKNAEFLPETLIESLEEIVSEIINDSTVVVEVEVDLDA